MQRPGFPFALLLLVAPVTAFAGPPDWERVKNPEALEATTTPRSLDEVRSLFADPPAEFRTAPLWVWNDELEWPRLEEQLRQYANLGFGGVFVHPRPGLMTEYIGEEWFDLWTRSLELGKELGLKVHIYDENSYPAGFSGGHVPSLAPDTAGSVLTYDWLEGSQRLPWTSPETVAIFAVDRGADGAPHTFSRLASGNAPPGGRQALVARLEAVGARDWTAGFPYVDLTDPRTTELFLETTYERYRQAVGQEFGRSVLWAFSDEPELSRKGGWNGQGLPADRRVLAEFHRRKGYDVGDHIPSLFWDVGEYRRVRFDYWDLIHSLLTEAFFEPMFTWCDRHQLQWTGHWWEHLWPYPWATPSDMSFYAFEHTPGIDMLIFGSRDLFARGVDPHMLFTVKQVASAANQLGRPRVLSETYGGGGWRATLEDFKRMGDWEIVHGVNLVNQHLSYATTRGARKRDWPQSFSDAAAWWPYYRDHADHTARLSLAMAAGTAHHRVLVLNPTTTALTLARRSDPTNGNADLEAIKADQGALVQSLADHQVDFDLGDEYLIEWLGSVEGRRLRVGRALYDVVVWPRHMDCVRDATAGLLSAFTRAGGTVVALGEPARYVDGREDAGMHDLAGRWLRVEDLAQVVEAVQERVPPRVRFDPPLPPGVGFAERVLDGGDRLLLFNNAGMNVIETVAEVEAGVLEEWDTLTGDVGAFAVQSLEDGHVRFPLELPPAGSLLLSVRAGGTPEIVERAGPSPRQTITAGPWTVMPEGPNVLVLDFCDVSVGERTLKDQLVMTAARTIFQEHGFKKDPWEMAVQFRTDTLDRNTFGSESGFTARFRFEVADVAATRDLELAVEAPELYTISVNGHAVSFAEAERWLDPHLLRAPIGRDVQEGTNVVTITGQPFDVRMSLEAVYLLGRFGLRPGEKGFELVRSRDLTFGPWAKQGRPFDSASVIYGTEVEVPEDGVALTVDLGRWHGSVAEVLVDGRRGALLGWPPWSADMPVEAGEHRLEIRVVATPRNVYGPFHHPDPPPRVLSPASWLRFADASLPPGNRYDVVDYGLFEAPTLSVTNLAE